VEYYTLPETPKIESHVELGIDDVKAKKTKNILEMIEIHIERMKVETQELSRRTMGKKWDNIYSQFPFIINLSESENWVDVLIA
jgi:hypothetical protein